MRRLLCWIVLVGAAGAQLRPDVDAPRKVAERVAEAAAARRAKDTPRLKRAMDEAVSAAGADRVAWAKLVESLYAYGLDELCVQICDHAAKTFAGDAAFLGFRGAARVRLKKNLEAVADLEAATKAEPKSPLWQSLLARAYLFAGREAEATKAIDVAEKLAPGAAPVLELRAEIQYRNQRFREAEATCERILALDAKSEPGAALLVRIRRADGRAAAAVEAADAALRRLPESGEIRLERGIACLALDRAADAVKDLEAAAARLPGDARPWMHLCRAYALTGRKDDAKRAKQKHFELAGKG